jgi:hypothetical protein
MRDDIHKGAKVSRVWRSFIKHSAREADWQSKSPLSAEKAVASLAREVSTQFLKAVKDVLSDRQINLPDSGSRLDEIKLKMPLGTLEYLVLERLAEEGSHRSLSDDSIKRSLHGALLERIEAEMRAVEVHARTKAPKDCPELMRRMRLALSKADLAKAFDPLPRKSPRQESAQAFDWDEDLGVH